MAEVLGPQTLLGLALPTGWDGTKLAEWEMRDGVPYGEMATLLSQAIGDFNAEMVRDWGWLFSLTEELAMEYEQGGSASEMPEITELQKPEAVSGTTIGHMLPLTPYGRGIGGSKRYFRDARMAKISADLAVLIRQARWRFEKKLLNRWFTNTENLIGAAGYDVPFVRGTGGAIDYAPPAYSGEAFTTAHNHYVGVDSASKDSEDVLEELAETLHEHGHTAPYDAMVADADKSLYSALTNWVQIVDPIVQTIDRGAASTGSQYFAAGTREFGMLGYYNSPTYGLVRVRSNYRVPTGFAGMCKSYGQLDARNPLAVRVHPDVGFGVYIVPETTLDDDYPVKQLDVEFEFGAGVGMDRTNGAAARLVSGGAWANPTIS